MQPLPAVVDDVHRVALGGQSPGERQGEPLLVLHDQESHAVQGRKGKLKIPSGGFRLPSASVGEIGDVENEANREEPA
ncbi:hypothetical protein GCM10019016_003540 [Streptomyces prasinosporus]|uniref:Uncharacterized protein n=1 Tax=Streptomyces prasinosporus TaxID=68256 RepID=A0ABP6TDM2_9ACTN